ncbi:MAG: AAA family ATPase [Magnetococcales bacterium]|nr:AAA family ATPase [Magnetococcales bacterium]
MYLHHFGLRDLPFTLTPDTGRFFPGAGREENLKSILAALTEGEGMVRVVGAPGTGKTMLCRMLCTGLPRHYRPALLLHPDLGPNSLLAALLKEFRVPVAEGIEPWNARQLLLNHLLILHRAGQRALLIIDEAHALPAASIEALRLLGNLETGHAKLLQIVLFAHERFENIKNPREARPILERVLTRVTLQPFNAQQTAHYLHARLVAAGREGNSPFTPLAARFIHLGSGGCPRRIHLLAHQALRQAHEDESSRVGSIHVWRAMAQDTPFAPLTQGYRPLIAGVFLTALLAAGIAPRYLISSPAIEQARLEQPAAPLSETPPIRNNGPEPIIETTHIASKAIAKADTGPEPRDEAVAKRSDAAPPSKTVIQEPPAPRNRPSDSPSSAARLAPEVQAPVKPLEMAARPAAEAQTPVKPVGMAARLAPEAQTPLQPVGMAVKPVARKTATPDGAPSIRPVATHPTRSTATDSLPYLKENDPFGEAILASHRWLKEGNDRHYTIQLMLLTHDRGLELLTDQLAAIQPPPGELDLKLFRLKDDTLLVHLNECPSALACEALMNRLPVAMRSNHPSVRSLARVKTTIHKLGLAPSQRVESAPINDRRS